MQITNLSKHKLFYTGLSLVSIGILFKIYHYLNELKNCKCYNDKLAYNKLSIDIEFLKAYQIFEMFLIIIFLFLIFLCKQTSNTKFNKSKFSLTFLTNATILLLAFVTGYISYNVFVLYSISKEKCKCLDKWQKYFIYIQGIMSSITFLRILFLLLFVFILTIVDF